MFYCSCAVHVKKDSTLSTPLNWQSKVKVPFQPFSYQEKMLYKSYDNEHRIPMLATFVNSIYKFFNMNNDLELLKDVTKRAKTG